MTAVWGACVAQMKPPPRMQHLQGRVKVGEEAALPPDLRKASGFPATPPPSFLPSAGRPSLSAERRGLVGTYTPRKGEAFPQVRRQSRRGMLSFGDFDATVQHPFRAGLT